MTEEQKQRKAIFIARATALFDTPEIRKEASELWDQKNSMQSDEQLKE